MNNIQNGKNNNFYITLLILLCTSLIILTNFVAGKNSEKNIFNNLMEAEYNKIWWKDNYNILKELQKNEILLYLDTIKKEKPELIEEIQNKIKASENNNLFLDKISIEKLKKDSFIEWNSWALISIIEYSDFECEYCIEYHKSNIISEIINDNLENINYLFKHFPLPTYKNSKIIAWASECIKKINNWSWYIDFINMVFNTTKWWWEWLDLSKLW